MGGGLIMLHISKDLQKYFKNFCFPAEVIMLGFKSFCSAKITIVGVESVKMIQKG